jgi:hypothetical protein
LCCSASALRRKDALTKQRKRRPPVALPLDELELVAVLPRPFYVLRTAGYESSVVTIWTGLLARTQTDWSLLVRAPVNYQWALCGVSPRCRDPDHAVRDATRVPSCRCRHRGAEAESAAPTRRAVIASAEEGAMQRLWAGLLSGLLLAAGTACSAAKPSSATPSPSASAPPPISAPVSKVEPACYHPRKLDGQHHTFGASGCWDDVTFHEPNGAVQVPVGGSVTLPPEARAEFVTTGSPTPVPPFFVTNWTDDLTAAVSFDGAQVTITPTTPLGTQHWQTLIPPVGASGMCDYGSVPLVCTVHGVSWLAFSTWQ